MLPSIRAFLTMPKVGFSPRNAYNEKSSPGLFPLCDQHELDAAKLNFGNEHGETCFVDTATGRCAGCISVKAECSLFVSEEEWEQVEAEKRLALAPQPPEAPASAATAVHPTAHAAPPDERSQDAFGVSQPPPAPTLPRKQKDYTPLDAQLSQQKLELLEVEAQERAFADRDHAILSLQDRAKEQAEGIKRRIERSVSL
jgi:hypothetical protein